MLIVSWARIASLLNSPIDAVGGVVVAAIAALVARGLIRRGEKKRISILKIAGTAVAAVGGSSAGFPARPDGSTPELSEEAVRQPLVGDDFRV